MQPHAPARNGPDDPTPFTRMRPWEAGTGGRLSALAGACPLQRRTVRRGQLGYLTASRALVIARFADAVVRELACGDRGAPGEAVQRKPGRARREVYGSPRPGRGDHRALAAGAEEDGARKVAVGGLLIAVLVAGNYLANGSRGAGRPVIALSSRHARARICFSGWLVRLGGWARIESRAWGDPRRGRGAGRHGRARGC